MPAKSQRVSRPLTAQQV